LLKCKSGKVDDRIDILVSEFPQLEITKLLGVPKKTIQLEVPSTKLLLCSWKNGVVFNELIFLVFDTTSRNTGRFQGAATCIEKTLGHAVYGSLVAIMFSKFIFNK